MELTSVADWIVHAIENIRFDNGVHQSREFKNERAS